MAEFKNGDLNLFETLVQDMKSVPTDIEIRLCLGPMGDLDVTSGMLKYIDIVRIHRHRVVEHS